MDRIYHPYWLWEDHKCGFYNNISGLKKSEMIDLVVFLFKNKELTKEYMFKVVEEWKYSCEHNLTNESLNKIAYIGQAACCLYGGVPSTITMEAWSKVDEESQKEADKIAQSAIDYWYEKNKKIQLCLNLD